MVNVLDKRKEELYSRWIKQLSKFKYSLNKTSLNLNGITKMFTTVFLVSYIRHMLIHEADNTEEVAWISDRGKMTSSYDGIYGVFYNIISWCMYYDTGEMNKVNNIKDIIPKKGEEYFTVDGLNRVPDIYTGAIAGYDFSTDTPSNEKVSELFNKLVLDNHSLIVLRVEEDSVTKVI